MLPKVHLAMFNTTSCQIMPANQDYHEIHKLYNPYLSPECSTEGHVGVEAHTGGVGPLDGLQHVVLDQVRPTHERHIPHTPA